MDRSQLYVRILVDDKVIPLSTAIKECRGKETCTYELVHRYIQSRLVSDIEELCFTHINYEELNSEDLPWWLVVTIVTPLVAISLYAIKSELNRNKLPEP